MKYFIIELLKFIKNNILKVAIITLLVAGLFVGKQFMSLYVNNNQNNKGIIDDEKRELLTNIQSSKPARVQLYIENAEDKTPFTNEGIVQAYLVLPEVLEETANATGIPIDSLIETTQNEIYVDTRDNPINFIRVGSDSKSGFINIRANIGNEEDNLKLISYYEELLSSSDVHFLENTEIYTYTAPYFVDEEEELLLGEEEQFKSPTHLLVKSGVIGVVLGLMFSVILLIILNFFSKKLHYSFFYTVFDEDYFVLIDQKVDNKKEVGDLLNYPTDKRTIVLYENNLETVNESFENKFKELLGNNHVQQAENLWNVSDFQAADQIVYVIKEGQTNRDWYNRQRKLLKAYHIPVTVIQINKQK